MPVNPGSKGGNQKLSTGQAGATPLGGSRAGRLQIGDQVWFRHAKAGEACERFDRIHLIRDGELVDTVPTYRGEGKNFG